MNINILQMVECPRECDMVDIKVCAVCILNDNVGSNTISCLWDEIGEPAFDEACEEMCSRCQEILHLSGKCRRYEDKEECSKVWNRYEEIVRNRVTPELVENRKEE